ncbi:MAG: aminomethyltransferase family protein [Candidatus Binatia bacterium]
MAKQSPLNDLHRSKGAAFVERDEWLLPAHFGDLAAEYQAVRSAAGLIDLCHRGLLQFTGPDRVSFLQGMLSNDLRALNPFDGQYAAILTQQGKVIADVRALCAMNSIYLDFWENLKDKILDHLNRFLIADEVEIADRSQEYAIISVQGPQAQALLEDVVAPGAELPTRPKQHAMADIEGAAVCVVYDSRTGEAGYDLIAPMASIEKIADKLAHVGKQFSAVWVGEDAQNILRIEAGIPRYGVDFTEDNLLLEVGIDHAFSFTKGCYLGQEVVERIRSRGHVNRKLCGLLIDGEHAADRGDLIEVESKEAGRITSSVISPQLRRPIALGYVGRDFWAPGRAVSIGPSRRRATVAPLPFLPSS